MYGFQLHLHYAIGHIHKRAAHAALGTSIFQVVLCIEFGVFEGDRDAWSLNICQEWQPLRITLSPAPANPFLFPQKVLVIDPVRVQATVRIVLACWRVVHIEPDSVGRARGAVRSRLSKGRLPQMGWLWGWLWGWSFGCIGGSLLVVVGAICEQILRLLWVRNVLLIARAVSGHGIMAI